ncbi:hypothetical protein [Escherichia coli]|uniref:hypothetical protein n=1 Tax=Escherichia coli TaxID=562 RepID=UPI0021574DDE|nr:hypothetical protein [Escherichia coli]
MESNIKGLVSAGHEMASELKAECGAVDMRSVAKLLSDLATQLEVQLVRANALAAENAALKESERAFDAMCAEEHGDNWVSELTETPATDAFLSEVRAQGVEMAMEHMRSSGSLTFGDCYISLNEFAAQLRKGGNQ